MPWAILTDVNENGRRVRHVHKVIEDWREARDFANDATALTGEAHRLRRVADEDEARALEIAPREGDDRWRWRDEALDRAAFETDTAAPGTVGPV